PLGSWIWQRIPTSEAEAISEEIARSTHGTAVVISFVKVAFSPGFKTIGMMKPLQIGTAVTPPGRVGRPHLLRTISAWRRYSSFTFSAFSRERKRRPPRWRAQATG